MDDEAKTFFNDEAKTARINLESIRSKDDSIYTKQIERSKILTELKKKHNT